MIVGERVGVRQSRAAGRGEQAKRHRRSKLRRARRRDCRAATKSAGSGSAGSNRDGAAAANGERARV